MLLASVFLLLLGCLEMLKASREVSIEFLPHHSSIECSTKVRTFAEYDYYVKVKWPESLKRHNNAVLEPIFDLRQAGNKFDAKSIVNCLLEGG